ncbi:MAG: hypothetical protein LBF65_01675 [Holosporales bacterium]|nr:hypothetical protein [Holosporales bacterium]
MKKGLIFLSALISEMCGSVVLSSAVNQEGMPSVGILVSDSRDFLGSTSLGFGPGIEVFHAPLPTPPGYRSLLLTLSSESSDCCLDPANRQCVVQVNGFTLNFLNYDPETKSLSFILGRGPIYTVEGRYHMTSEALWLNQVFVFKVKLTISWQVASNAILFSTELELVG